MVKSYFDKKIKRQNQFIYLKNGRWLVILVLLIVNLFIAESRLISENDSGHELLQNFRATLLFALPAIVTYLLLILYIVPYYFKRNRYKQFWRAIVCLLLMGAIAEVVIRTYMESQAWLPAHSNPHWIFIFKCLLTQIVNLLGLTGILFIFEIFEEVNLSKESLRNLQVWRESERKMKGTNTDFPYMMQSLRGIQSKLKGAGRVNESTTASESMLLFADILRYKLYGYDQIYVPVAEEMNVVSNLVRFYNSVLTEEYNVCELEQVGNAGEWMIEKQLLVNIIYPFLKNSESPFFQHIICFIEITDSVMNLTIQADYTVQVEMEQILEKIHESVAKNEDITNFETQIENNCIILNICLTLTKK